MTLHDIDLRIRALTTILALLDRQASPPTKGSSSIDLTVAIHIATLLTRGADKGPKGKIGLSFRPVAVATRVTAESTNILATIDGDPKSPGLSNVTQNPTLVDPPSFCPNKIKSRDLELDELKQFMRSSQPSKDVTLHQHIADVVSLFNTFRTVPQTGLVEVYEYIIEFIVQRCAPIISHRLRSDKFILKKPLDNILQGWKPSDADLFSAAEVEIPELLRRFFEAEGIGYRQSNGKHFAPWTKEVAPGWMNLFLRLLSKCKDYIQLSNNEISPEIKKGAILLRSLQRLVRTGGFKSLLELESVKAILDREMLNPRSARSDIVNPDPESEAPGDIHDNDPELLIATDEDSVTLTMRYLGNAVAWITATEFLLSIQRKRRAPELHLHLAITPCPVDPTAMADAPKIFTDAFNEFLDSRGGLPGSLSSNVDSWSKGFAQKLKLQEFTGTVHCEASLMGAIVKYGGQVNTEGRTTQNANISTILRSTSNKPRAIGVAKKCCWCCDTLAALLRSTGIRFNLPGSHGQIFAWALPSIGVSEKVASSLEAKLQEQLSLAIQRHVDDLERIPQSQTSSPASSDLGIDWMNSYSSDKLEEFLADLYH